MKIKSMIMSGILISLTAATSTAFAAQKACPSVETVKLAANKLDQVEKSFDSYTVSTSKPAFNDSDSSWKIGTAPINAQDDTDALEQARDNVSNLVSQINQYAIVLGDSFVCNYNGKVAPVAAIANIKN